MTECTVTISEKSLRSLSYRRHQTHDGHWMVEATWPNGNHAAFISLPWTVVDDRGGSNGTS